MIHLEFFDAHLGVRADRDDGEHVKALWSAFTRPTQDLPDDATVFDITPGRLADALSALVVDVNAFALQACDDLAIHAGVVDIAGVTLALPGTSGAGKSTLTAACVRAGMGYISDEALCLQYERPAVRAYPRPFALSPWSMRALGFPLTTLPDVGRPATVAETTEFVVAPAVLGEICATPGPLRHIVVPRRTARARAELQTLHRSEVVALMLKLSFNHFKYPADAFELMVRSVRDAEVWELRYGEPVEAARLLLDRFG